jgi:hypothetical protein
MSKFISIRLEQREAEDLDEYLYYTEEFTNGNHIVEKVRKQIEEQI